jgi:hypothetical protein
MASHLIAASSSIHTSHSEAYSATAQQLLKITPESLKKSGFDAQTWANYIRNNIKPDSLKNGQILSSISSLGASVVGYVNDRSLYLIDTVCKKLAQIKYTVKDWKNSDEILLDCMSILYLIKAAMLQGGGGKEGMAVIEHLAHLFASKLSLNGNYSVEGAPILCFEDTQQPAEMLVYSINSNGLWNYCLTFEKACSGYQLMSERSTQGILPLHSILFKNKKVETGQFVHVSFMIDSLKNIELTTKVIQKIPLTKGEIEKIDYRCDVTYSNGDSSSQGVGNSILFRGNYRFNSPFELEPKLNDSLGHSMRQYAQLAAERIGRAWFESIKIDQINLHTHQATYLLPKSEEDADLQILSALELALEAPEKNEQLIHWISDRCGFEYSPEELAEVSVDRSAAVAPLEDASESKCAEEIEIVVSATTIARAMINKIKSKAPKLQQPKPRPDIRAAAAASSYKAPVMSKEETKARLNKSKMPEALKQQSLDLLDGVRLRNKREEDKFFLDILSFQAKKSGGEMQLGNSSGSHHSARLIKQTSQSGKITYRAVTLVNKHGVDASRGHSLGVQQSKLIKLFTPLG